MIILANLASFNPTRLAFQAVDIFLEDQFTAENREAPVGSGKKTARKPAQIDPAIYAEYAGRYVNDSGFVIRIAKENDQLALHWPGLPRIELLPETTSRFFQAYDPDVFIFAANRSGKTDHLFVERSEDKIRFNKFIESGLEKSARYTGKYLSDELHTTYKIFIEQNQLFLQAGGSSKRPLETTGAGVFFGEGGKLNFQSEAGGISGFRLDAGRVKNLKFMKVE